MNVFENILAIVRSLKTLSVFAGLMGWMTTLAMFDVASLPDDAMILKDHLADYVQKYHEVRRYAEGLEQAITTLRRMHFGPKRERIPQGQQIFGFYGTLEASKPAAAQESPEKPPAKRKPDREGSRVLPEDLPVKVVLVDLPEDHEPPARGEGRPYGSDPRLAALEAARRHDAAPQEGLEPALPRSRLSLSQRP
jgi:hypothetical protein